MWFCFCIKVWFNYIFLCFDIWRVRLVNTLCNAAGARSIHKKTFSNSILSQLAYANRRCVKTFSAIILYFLNICILLCPCCQNKKKWKHQESFVSYRNNDEEEEEEEEEDYTAVKGKLYNWILKSHGTKMQSDNCAPHTPSKLQWGIWVLRCSLILQFV